MLVLSTAGTTAVEVGPGVLDTDQVGVGVTKGVTVAVPLGSGVAL